MTAHKSLKRLIRAGMAKTGESYTSALRYVRARKSKEKETMLSRELELTLNAAFKDAKAKRHEFMTVEHLLLALLDNADAAAVLKTCGGDIETLRQGLKMHIDATTPLIPREDSDRDTAPTLGFQRVLQRAVFQVQSSGRKEVTGGIVLIALFGEPECHVVYLLKQQDIARIDVVKCLAHGGYRWTLRQNKTFANDPENLLAT